jgi:1,4-alpha-glucan branching enzyme
LNSDAAEFGGSGQTNPPTMSEALEAHGKSNSIHVKLAPLATMIFECKQDIKKKITKKAK